MEFIIFLKKILIAKDEFYRTHSTLNLGIKSSKQALAGALCLTLELAPPSPFLILSQGSTLC